MNTARFLGYSCWFLENRPWNRTILEKETVVQLVNKFTALNGYDSILRSYNPANITSCTFNIYLMSSSHLSLRLHVVSSFKFHDQKCTYIPRILHVFCMSCATNVPFFENPNINKKYMLYLY
jgi:hypothetical protein